ncbi:MAG: class I SAM-dependent methyltransferase [Pirellulales bacterium]
MSHVPSWFETRRELSPTTGTAAELFRDPGQVESVYPRLRPFLSEPAVLEAIERDPVPMPATIDREGYCGDQHLAYWLTGLEDLRMVQRHVPDASFRHVLDFGGASGRFARHIILADNTAQVTITDLNVNHIEWVERYFGPAVRGIKVSPYPHFPLSDNSVTLCVGLSVFTHIDAYETGWLAEIHRVLAEGAYALLTIHSEDTWRALPIQGELLKRLQRHPEFNALFELGQPKPMGRHVFTSNPNSIEHSCNVFIDSDYIYERWGRWFEIVDIAHRAHHDFQAAVIVRKKSSAN